ncbi:MAG: T9SS type A sorting domain-containing protein [Candidatus Electryonea clarkiae]|nr:T9SS type A sorting domain-containing protein [Candidatus Electryonea clarkiae]
MKNILYTLLFCLILPLNAYCELAIDTLWQTTFSIDQIPIRINDIVYSGDGEWIAVGGGEVRGDIDTSLAIVLRINEDGSITDSLILPGKIFNQVIAIENGEVIIDGIENNEEMGRIPILARLNTNFEFEWYYMPSPWGHHDGKILLTESGNLVLFRNYLSDSSSAFIYSNLDGEITDTTIIDSLGGTDWLLLKDFKNDSIFYITGEEPYYGSKLLKAIDHEGTIAWSFSDSTDGFEEIRYYKDIKQLDDGILVFGSVYYDMQGRNGLILKFTDQGELLWTSVVDIPNLNLVEAINTGNGSYLAVGSRSPQVQELSINCVTLFDENGELLDAETFQDTMVGEYRRDRLNCISTNQDSSIFIAGGNIDRSAVLLGLSVIETTVKIERDNTIPGTLTLSAPYPNPFNSTTRFQYSLPEALPVQISVTNLLGRLILEQNLSTQSAGSHQFIINSSGLTSGTYLVNLETSHGAISRRIVVLK